MATLIRNLIIAITLISSTTILNLSQAAGRSENGGIRLGVSAPEFPQKRADQWLNSEPLTLEGLRGKVVMIDFWTFGCWNCYRSFPWMNEMEARFEGEDFIIIGVHTPEFEREKKRDNVIEKIAEFKLKHPTVMDNDFNYWKAMNNRFWPSYYLIDKKGIIRKNYIGETHAGTSRAIEIETQISKLLNE